MQLVYGPTSESAVAEEEQNSSESEASDDEDFFKPKGEREKVTQLLVRDLATVFHKVPNFNYLCLPSFFVKKSCSFDFLQALSYGKKL